MTTSYPFEQFREASERFESLAIDQSDERTIAYGDAAALLELDDATELAPRVRIEPGRCAR